MHKYIDYDILRDRSKPKTIDDVCDDLTNKYKITNIADDDGYSLSILATALMKDYECRFSNYEGYAEEGMNARMLMELRKSAILPFDEHSRDFYRKHGECETVEEVKCLRILEFKKYDGVYYDRNWEYFFLIKQLLKKQANGIIFDFEECYADGDWSKQTNSDMYIEDFKKDFIRCYNSIFEEIEQLKIIDEKRG